MALTAPTNRDSAQTTRPHSCSLCGSSQQSWVVSRNGFDIYRCGKCLVQYVYPLPTPSEVLAHYDRQDSREHRAASGLPPLKTETAPDQVDSYGYIPRGGRFRAADRRQIARWILRKTGGGRVLDAGCSQGDLLAAMAEIPQFDPVGLDLNSSAVAYAQGRGLNAIHGSLENTSMEPGSFDIAVLWHVLEHTHNPVDAMKSVASFLRPQGWFVGCFPSPSHIKARIAGKRWHHYCPPTHLWFFTKPSIRIICREAGLDMVEASLLHYHANMTVVAQKAEP